MSTADHGILAGRGQRRCAGTLRGTSNHPVTEEWSAKSSCASALKKNCRSSGLTKMRSGLTSGERALLEALIVQCLHLGPPKSDPLLKLEKVAAAEIATNKTWSTTTMYDLDGELAKELASGFTCTWPRRTWRPPVQNRSGDVEGAGSKNLALSFRKASVVFSRAAKQVTSGTGPGPD